MTNLIEQQHQGTLTPVADEKHIHAFMVKVAVKATWLSKYHNCSQSLSHLFDKAFHLIVKDPEYY